MQRKVQVVLHVLLKKLGTALRIGINHLSLPRLESEPWIIFYLIFSHFAAYYTLVVLVEHLFVRYSMVNLLVLQVIDKSVKTWQGKTV